MKPQFRPAISNNLLSTLWEIFQIIALLVMSGVLIINPVGSIEGLLTTVGFFILVVNIIQFIYAWRKNEPSSMIAAFIEGFLGVFLVINSIFSLKIFSILIGIFLIISSLIGLVVYSTTRKRLLPLGALVIGMVLIIFPTLGTIAISYLLAASFVMLALNKIGKLT